MEEPALADDPDFASQPERVARRDALEARVNARFATAPRATVVEWLDAAGIAYASLNTALELGQHPHLRRANVAIPGGDIALPLPPARHDGASPELGAVPALDADGAAIRAEFAA